MQAVNCCQDTANAYHSGAAIGKPDSDRRRYGKQAQLVLKFGCGVRLRMGTVCSSHHPPFAKLKLWCAGFAV
jgi:hypothetical protein